MHSGSAETRAGGALAPGLAAALEPLRAAPASAAILCDLDGTLAPIVARPEAVEVPEAAREALRGLAARYALVGVVSGRRAADARRIVGLDELAYSGNHGFERLPPRAREPVPAPALAGREEDAARFVGDLDGAELERAGFRLEDKGAIVALHWRGAADEGAAEGRAREIAAEAESAGLVSHLGRKVLEVRPGVAIDKGAAAEDLLGGERIRAAMYGGDDRTDADAFRALREMRSAGRLDAAVAVAVASDETPPGLIEASDFRVEGTGGYLGVLRHLAG